MENAFVKSDSKEGGIFNVSFFLDGGDKTKLNMNNTNTEVPSPPKEKKKRKAPSKIVKADDDTELEQHQSNVPYKETYCETNNMLKSSIVQIDMLQGDIREDITKIRSSNTLKKKYDYIADLTSANSNLISTKITAIRELNKSITDSHNLELKRMKDLKLNENEKDDDKYIMDMYNAFISTPIGTRQAAMPQNQMDLTTINNNLIRADLNMNAGMYDQQNINPTQNMMRLEVNPNIKTVVIHDGLNTWFDVIDITTGEPVPNVDKPDSMFLEDTNLDFNNGVARNTNLDITYPLIVVKNNSILNEY